VSSQRDFLAIKTYGYWRWKDVGNDMPLKELKVNGVYRLDGQSGALSLVVSDLPRPNGIVFSPAEKWLYVSNSEPRLWMRYPVQMDGSLGKGQLLFDASQDKRKGNPDGMEVDSQGNLYSAGPGGVWVFSASGQHLATLAVPEVVSNVAFGGSDKKTLFITASSSVYRTRVLIPGKL
jgi:gluconolactonase